MQYTGAFYIIERQWSTTKTIRSRDILRQRIQEIADHQADSLSRKAKSMGIFLLTLLIVFGFSALFALEEGGIAPGSTARTWDGSLQPFAAWNQDQTLRTAMENSVNWYFQDLDGQTGLPAHYRYYDRIGYGNRDLAGGINSYWTGSSLKISPVEQVVLLSAFWKINGGFRRRISVP